jgi:hypothetical protein
MTIGSVLSALIVAIGLGVAASYALHKWIGAGDVVALTVWAIVVVGAFVFYSGLGGRRGK